MDLQLDWKFSNMPQLDIAASVTQEIGNVARKVFPDIADMFPMTSSPEMNYYFDNDWMIFTLVNRYAISAPPAVGLFSEDKIRYIKEKLPQNKVLSSEELYSLFGDEWFSEY